MPLRLVLPVLAILAVPALAQPTAGLGPYVAFSSATPEQTLFRYDASPLLTAGVRLGGGVAVEAGVASRRTTQLFGSSSQMPAEPGGTKGEMTSTRRALTLGASLRQSAGAVEARTRGTVALGRASFERHTERVYTEDGYVEVDQVERSAATLGHAGASVALAVPIEREGGRMAPGVGLAVAVDRRLAGSPVSDVTSWGVFLTTPTTVAVGSMAVTLDTSVGVYRTDFFTAGSPWTLALDGAVRVDF